ncbi:hypothetical protein N7491_009671 [Penicillium cf. griseofulvum]|nr:hypothetical protein N7491_009671 [Penicillium cf. griseofulvum]
MWDFYSASAASAGPPRGPPPPLPDHLFVTPTASTLFSLVRRATTVEGGAEYYIVRLTAYGNAALRELCRTLEQREVWSWPSYEFLVKIKKDRTLVISANQIDPQYTAVVYAIGLAKATHLVNLSYDCLVPRRDAVPIASAPLPPPSRVKELTDSDEANDNNGASGDGGGTGTGGTATAV